MMRILKSSLVVFLNSLVVNCLSNTFNVPADYPTIQQAINAASVSANDVVLVSNGVYLENLDFKGKAITVTSVNGPQVTIIDGSKAGPVVNFSNGEGPGSIIKGFTIQNGYYWLGCGINLQVASPTIIGNIIRNNIQEAGYTGAAIGGRGSSPRIEQNYFQNNSCFDNYSCGVVSFNGISSPIIANNIFLNNSGYVISISTTEPGTPIVVNNTIVGGSAGIEVYYGTTNDIFCNNILCYTYVGLQVDFGGPGNYPTWRNNLVYGEQTSYNGIADQSGTNGNLSSDPLFACPSDDFHLLAGSPCIDHGTSMAPHLSAADFDGNPRVLAGQTNAPAIVDIGAYEFNPASPPSPCLYLYSPTNVVATAIAGQNSAVVSFPPPFATSVATVTCTPASGSVFPAGTNIVLCTLTYGTNTLTSTFTVTVLVPPFITNQPSLISVLANNNANFCMSAFGTLPMHYQWSFDGAAIAGATNSTLTVSNAQAINEGYYQVTLANDWGAATSGPIVLRVLPSAALIVSEPRSITESAGNQAAFDASVVGSGPLVLQWYKNGALLAGANSSELVLSNVQAADAGTYQLLASNALRTVVSTGAVLTVLPARPWFSLQPASMAGFPGNSVSFSSLAMGSDDDLDPIIYTWYFKSNILTSQTGATLSLASIAPANQGAYYVVATNTYGSATSVVVQLTVYQAPTLPNGLTNKIVDQGSNLVLNPSANGTPPLAYSWSFNNTLLSNTTPFLSLTNIAPSQSGYYSITITNQFGSVSATGKVSVFLPASQVVAWGDDSGGQTDVPTDLDDAVAVVGGDYHSVALRHNGTLLAWGFDEDGQTDVPTNSLPFVSIKAGAGHNLAIAEDGTVVAWGRNDFGQATVPTNVIGALDVAAGESHSLALLESGSIIAWGDNSYGQTALPLVLAGYWWYDWRNDWFYTPPQPAQAIAAGRNHNLALMHDGTVVGWGDNSFQQSSAPSGLSNVVAIAAGYLHSIALCSNGTVVAWGDNTFGQTNVPVGLTNVVAITAGDFQTFALCSGGRIVAWGDNSLGQTNVPSAATKAVAVASGYYHGLALVPFIQVLRSHLTHNGLVLSWNGTGVLQWSPTPTGPYSDVPFVGNIWTNAEMSASAKFFRVRH